MNVHIIDLHFLEKDHTIGSFLIESSAGPLLIECGPHSTFAMLEAGLARHGYRPADVRHVFLSHIHFDHAGAAWAFAELGANIYLHPLGKPHMAQPAKLYDSAKRIYGNMMETLWGIMRPIPEAQLIATAHGEAIQVGEHSLRAWHTPGHATHHIAWQIGPLLFTGDVAGVKINGGIVLPPCPPPDIHVEDWQASLRLIRDLAPEALYLTHYGRVDHAAAHLDELEQRLLAYAEWMKAPFLAGEAADSIVPRFQAFVQDELRANGIHDETALAQYEAANPAFMSVAGLLRYWKKRLAD